MDRFLVRAVAPVLALCLVIPFAGCSSKSETTAAGAASSQLAGLYSSLGGAEGVSALANTFGAKMALNPNITKFLDPTAISGVQNGLVNSLSSLAGIAPPAGSIDLLTSLSGKGLNKEAVDGVNGALLDAGKERGLGDKEMQGLKAVMDPVNAKLTAGM